MEHPGLLGVPWVIVIGMGTAVVPRSQTFSIHACAPSVVKKELAGAVRTLPCLVVGKA